MTSNRKKKPKLGRVLVRWLAVFALVAIVVYFVAALIFRPAFVRYPGFGISLPSKYSIHGIDVSRYQKNINWKMVKAMQDRGVSLQFAYIKATEGTLRQDPLFRRNWVSAKEAGVLRGAYHFFNANRSGKAQAKNFIQTVNLISGDLPPVLDVEKSYGLSKDIIQTEVAAWLEEVEATYGVKPIIYTNVNFYKSYLADKFDEYPLWVAHYFADAKPRIERDWLFWQHSEQGRVNGIDAAVDFNAFSGNNWDFENLRIP